MDKMELDSKQLAYKIRKHAIKMISNAHASHIGGVLSCSDIVAVLYADILKYNPNNPDWSGRDRFILSKGHNGVALYAALAECGFFPIELLATYGQNGSVFSCHVSHKNVPGVEISTGSLGHGIGMAAGMALAAKAKSMKHHIYTLIGDGECNEGSVWEAAMLAYQYQLDNFTVVVDRNNMQAMGKCESVIDMDSMSDKWRAFGWHVVEVADGNNHDELKKAFANISSNGNPRVIIANTIKGKGVSFMENELLWHYRDPQGEFYERALNEIDEKYFDQE